MKPPFPPPIHRRQAGRSVSAAEMTTATRRRHGWQRPLHPLQIVGMAVFSFLAVPFYIFLGLLLGSGAAEITVTTIFSFVVFSTMFMFVWCTAIDPTDKTSYRKKKRGSEAMALANFCADSSSSPFQLQCLIRLSGYFFLFLLE